MKKTISILLVAMLLVSVLSVFASAADGGKVRVTIYDGKELVVTNWSVDIAGDGTDTIGSVLKGIHESMNKKFETATTEYGESITCLWGIENGGAYGYYVNDKMSSGLSDKLNNGDYLYAYVYSDAQYYTDTYSYFNLKTTTQKEGNTILLKLSHIGFDESWNSVVLPVEGATITIDGVKTEYVTGSDGSVTVKVDKDCIISAVSDTLTLIPPFCAVSVLPGETIAPAPSGSSFPWAVVIVVCAVAIAAAVCVVIFVGKKKQK